MSCLLSTRNPQHGASVSDPNPECVQERVDEAKLGILPSEFATQPDGDEDIVITDLARGLGRTPAGFYVAVCRSGQEWRTDNKPVLANNDTVELSRPIPVLSDISISLSLAIHVSFGFQLVSSNEERLRFLIVTVGQLIGNSVRDLEEGHDKSLLVIIRQRDDVSFASIVPVAHRSGTNIRGLDLGLDGRHDMFGFLTNLVNSLRARFRRLGEQHDSGEVNVRTTTLFRVAVRNQCLGQLSNLENSTLKQQDIVQLICGNHPGKLHLLNQLADYLETRFGDLGEPCNPKEAISSRRGAMQLHSDNHALMLHSLFSLCRSLFCRLERCGELSNLAELISRQRNAVDLTPSEHPGRANIRCALGSSLRTRFTQLGDPSDLEEAISMQRDAVGLVADGDPQKPMILLSLSESLETRFEHLGQFCDLQESMLMQREAVDLTPDTHPRKACFLNNLGNTLRKQFKRFGMLSALEESIVRHKSALHLNPHGHPKHLMGLANALGTRFEILGELADIEEAISMQQDAIVQADGLLLERPNQLSNLGLSFLMRYTRLGRLNDLEEAISNFRNAVGLTPDGHHDKPRRLICLGNSLYYCFQHLGELGNLDEAISMQRDAIDLTPDGHPFKPRFLGNLGALFKARFERLGELSDLEESITRHKNAVNLAPDGHPDTPVRLNELGKCFVARFERLGELGDLEQASILFSRAACAPVAGHIASRFEASRQWIICSRRLARQSLIQPYSVAIHLLPQLAWIGFSLSRRFSELGGAPDVVSEAVAAALDSGRPETAVEWLEQGRSIVWGGMFELRSSYAELSSAYPNHARRLHELSAALEHASTTRELGSMLEQTVDANHRSMESYSLKKVTERHRTLAIERDRLLEDIRKLPGFERFLLHKEFSQLRAAAHAGPVVMLNATKDRCDALIVLADVDHVIHVPLRNFTLQRSIDFQASLKGFIRQVPVARDDRDGRPIPQESSGQWKPMLASLWKCVVKPVLDALALSVPGELRRIFWCPAGPFTFLPIHAAGFYDVHHSQPGHKIYDFVVSSYVPTLSILAPSHRLDPASDKEICLLAVPQPHSDGQTRLPGVAAELEHIRTAIRNSPSVRVTLVEASTGTVEEVLDQMKEADWVHFACHGVQDDMKPIESGLCLADRRRLKLSDVVSLSRSRGGLAFLSACQTARGDEDLSDEAIHIAAGMLYAGYGGVIGSTWSISDRYAPNVAKDVYEQLFSDGTRPDHREAARALQVAIGRLRDKNVPFVDWIPFVHVGL